VHSIESHNAPVSRRGVLLCALRAIVSGVKPGCQNGCSWPIMRFEALATSLDALTTAASQAAQYLRNPGTPWTACHTQEEIAEACGEPLGTISPNFSSRTQRHPSRTLL